eukprot:c20495_g2_i1.p1 GENE.c20495_g2_i1~~c20495_g2_i1.p1  ORF type:complete len:639 (-),score=294.78 c20495_g2_i1:28-1944(-)
MENFYTKEKGFDPKAKSVLLFGVIPLTVLVVVIRKIKGKKTKKQIPIPEPGSTEYDMFELPPARLVGRKLRILGYLLKSPTTGNFICGNFFRNSPFSRLRPFAAKLHLMPTSFVIPRLSEEETKKFQIAADDLKKRGFLSFVTPSKKHSGFRHLESIDFYNAYKSGKITPSQVAEEVIRLVGESHQGEFDLSCVTQMEVESIRKQAIESDKRWKEGKELGVLDGVPFFTKDVIDISGYSTTFGTKFIGDKKCTADVTQDNACIQRLKAEGAISMGKVSTHEFGTSILGHNPHYGAPKNPHALTSSTRYYAGGSSSGSAVVVASGLVPFSIGGDAGGSIRVPASLCGVVGLKPTFGRIPSVQPFGAAWTMGDQGPMSATVNDTALSYIVMAGSHVKSIHSQNQPPVHLDKYDKIDSLNDITIGVYNEYVNDCDSSISKAVNEMINLLQTQKQAKIKQINIPNLSYMSRAHALIIATEMAYQMDGFWEEHSSDLGIDTLFALSFGKQISAMDLHAASKIRTFAMKTLRELFETVDLIVTPTNAMTAPELLDDALIHGEINVRASVRLSRYAFLANLCGVPAISVPIGFDEKNLPIGIQFFAKHWNEHTLLRVARAVEQIREGQDRKPSQFHSPLSKDLVK